MASENEDVSPPGPIQFLSVRPDSVSLCWSPPEDAPGHRTFKVTRKRGQKRYILEVTSTILEVTELTPGEKYHFSVATLSQDGRQSIPVEGAVYTEVPPPQNLQVEVTSPTATVTWTKPDGVDHVTYLLEIIRDQEVISTMQRESCQYTITGLQIDANYNINVTTVLSNGRQSQPAVETFRADIPPPGPIQFVSVQPDSVSLRWSPPEGAPDHSTFNVTWTGDQKHDSLSVTGTTLERIWLTPGEKYHFTVATLSQDGRQSTPVEGVVYTEVPPPQNLQVDVDLKSLTATVTWTKPAGVDQVTYLLEIIKDQEVIHTVHTAPCLVNCNSQREHTITDLQMLMNYTVNASTVLSNGRHSKPAYHVFKPEVPPPQNLQVDVDLRSRTARVSWTKPAGVGPVTYQLEIIKDQEVISTIQTSSCNYTITDLQILVNYTVNITTAISDGRHSKSASHIFKLEVPPPQNLWVDVDLRSRTARVSWTKPAAVGPVAYQLEIINNQGHKHTMQTSSCNYTITDLQILVNYTINITTVISDGRHSKYASHIFRPGPPLRIVLIGKTGEGKSAAVDNTILGRKAYRNTYQRCYEDSNSNPRQINMFDPSLIFDASRDEIEEDILDCIRLSRPGPHAFLLVIKLGHLTKEDQNAVRALQEIFGEKVKDHIIILFTHGDQLKGQTIEEYVSIGPKELQELIRSCGGRFHVFDNTKEIRDRTQVVELLTKIDEMVAANGGQHFTDEMYEETTRVMKERNLGGDPDLGKIAQHLSFLPLLQKRVVEFYKTLRQ